MFYTLVPGRSNSTNPVWTIHSGSVVVVILPISSVVVVSVAVEVVEVEVEVEVDVEVDVVETVVVDVVVVPLQNPYWQVCKIKLFQSYSPQCVSLPTSIIVKPFWITPARKKQSTHILLIKLKKILFWCFKKCHMISDLHFFPLSFASIKHPWTNLC